MISIASAFVLLVAAPAAYGSGSVSLSYGNNIWGSTVGAGFDMPLSKHWGLGIAYGTGYFKFTANDGGDFFIFSDLPGDEHRVTLDFRHIVDTAFYYRRVTWDGTHFFNDFAFGVSQVFVTLNSEFEREGTPGTMKAARDYSLYGLYASVNFVDFVRAHTSNTVFSVGLRSRLTVMDSPVELYYANGAGLVEKGTMFSRLGEELYFPYPEVFVTVGHTF